ncbi:hypothetical protein [Lapillicoccus sp.]|uniref:hypothetical protein n=1 Tax=Lapillicoccus sp. TaxID=1909287 RepID=UPI0025F4124D|nr:hypothetical protein [Lapillicoccus sp.]
MSDWGTRVLALEPAFRRAPSAHNTQPWTLRAEADAGAEGDALVLGWDPTRELHVGDPTRRDLWLSLGAFAESVVIAAASDEVGVGVEWDVSTRRSIAGRLVEQPLLTRHFTSEDLAERHSARGPYAAPWATIADVDAMAAAAGLAGTGASLTVVPGAVVDDLLPVADRWSYEPPALVDELRHWLRLDHGDPRYREDGLSDVALALSPAQAGALRVALSPRVWPLLRRAGGPSVLGAASKIDGRGTVVAFHAPVELAARPEDVADLGRALLRVWLAAGARGLRTHPVSVLVDAPATAGPFAVAVDRAAGQEPGSSRVLSVFRIGRPVDEPITSARRTVPVG